MNDENDNNAQDVVQNEQEVVNNNVETEQPISQDHQNDQVNEAEESFEEDQQDRTFTQEEVEKLLTKQLSRAERRYNKRLKEMTNTQSQQVNNTVFDPLLNTYIPANTTREEYSQMILNFANGQQPQPVNNQQQVTHHQGAQQHVEQRSEPDISDAFIKQYEKCMTFNDDAEQVFSMFPSSFVRALDVGARAGKPVVENVYKLQKEDPKRAWEISQMAPEQQIFELAKLDAEMANRRKKKVTTNATPQPAPLGNGSGDIVKSYHDMGYAEKKKLREQQKAKQRGR